MGHPHLAPTNVRGRVNSQEGFVEASAYRTKRHTDLVGSRRNIGSRRTKSNTASS
jgi:hypothetical protein